MDKKETNVGYVMIRVTRRQYSEALKLQVCKEHIEEGTGLLALVKKYNLTTHSLINGWLRKYGYLPSPTIARLYRVTNMLIGFAKITSKFVKCQG